MNLLLLSNSRTTDGRYLPHAVEPLRALLDGRKKAVFIPFAGVTVNWDEYTDRVREALMPLSLKITGIHTLEDPVGAVGDSEIILVGGGNTFQLLKLCRWHGLLPEIAARVRDGAIYMGWSAGSNLACPTICSTNDMPIVNPDGLDALGLIPFQINPHYTNALPEGHQGETRDQRLAELLAANPQMRVLGLPEGDWLQVSGDQVLLCGPHPACIFRAGREPESCPGNTALLL